MTTSAIMTFLVLLYDTILRSLIQMSGRHLTVTIRLSIVCVKGVSLISLLDEAASAERYVSIVQETPILNECVKNEATYL